MSPSDTAYSEDTTPKRHGWASNNAINQHQNAGVGSGPGVVDPDDSIQNSDSQYAAHQDKVDRTVGPGPGTSGRKTVQAAGLRDHDTNISSTANMQEVLHYRHHKPRLLRKIT